ncbi:MAG: undecaprenyl-diphosphate phosphatase [Alphaproteobacteria bacterium]|nr:MAG: undecaprenyl-diphosphate phosphatase [Alphaproteobacteria bacterium]
MPIDQIILLALIQGLTEFLPISSSAHLILLPLLTAYEDQGLAIDVAVHVGSLGAVVTYFHKEILRLIRALPDALCFRTTAETRLILFLVIGTIPAVLFGLALSAFEVTDLLRTKEVIAVTSIFFGIVLYLADRLGARLREMESLTMKDAVLIGLAQAIALIPGTSRSGITMTAGRALGLTRVEAARFSMLLSIPIIVASGTLATVDLMEEGARSAFSEALIAAGLSFASALACIWIFLRVLDRIGFTPFVIYRVALGIALLTVF